MIFEIKFCHLANCDMYTDAELIMIVDVSKQQLVMMVNECGIVC